jgi:hypothetical protein
MCLFWSAVALRRLGFRTGIVPAKRGILEGAQIGVVHTLGKAGSMSLWGHELPRPGKAGMSGLLPYGSELARTFFTLADSRSARVFSLSVPFT